MMGLIYTLGVSKCISKDFLKFIFILQQNRAVMEAWFPAETSQLADIGDAVMVAAAEDWDLLFP